MTRGRIVIGAIVAVAAGTLLAAQQPQRRPASPPGSAAAQIGSGASGKWIEVTSGRPLKRGRDLWGSGADYGKKVLLQNDPPVWRAGANVTTRLKTEVPLQMGGTQVPAGEYSLFIDAKSPSDWTLIVSSWAAQQKYDANNKDALWGSFGYTPEKDVVRVKMTVGTLPLSLEQLTWAFVDMRDTGGKLAIMWDTVVASVPFTIQQTSTAAAGSR